MVGSTRRTSHMDLVIARPVALHTWHGRLARAAWARRPCHVMLLSMLFTCIGCQSTAPSKSAGRTFDVHTYGAVGDGGTKDTAAFQKALDACAAERNGGEVLVPAGNYLIGSVVLGSNTTLRLDKDATLTGSPDVADYPVMTIRWEGVWRDGH